jgi:glycerophosphoryl diester phosphodiesterase
MKKLGLSLGILLFIYLGLRLVPARSVESKPVFDSKGQFVVAHRCGRNVYPENTLYACKELAKSEIADYFEMDFHLTKDLVPVVIHDDRVDRTTNGSGLVSDLTLAELQSLDAGYRFTMDGGETFPYRGKGIRVETLEETFRTLTGRKLMVEVKPDSTEAADLLLALIQKYKLENRIIVGSFHQNIKDYLYQKAPQLTYFASSNEVILWTILEKFGLSHLYKMPAHLLAVPKKQSILEVTPEYLKSAQKQNLKVHVWTINDAETMQELIDMKVDGIMSDDPILLRKLYLETQKAQGL